MTETTLAEYVDINPATGVIDRASDTPVAFVPMAAVSEEGRLVAQVKRPIADVAKGYTYFERGDVLMAKITPCMENGKAALLDSLETQCGFGSTEFHVLRARPGVDPRFVFYLVWNQRFRDEAAKHMTGSAGQKRVPTAYLRQAKVPRVSQPDQRRIADILDKAVAIRRKRKEAIALTEELQRSAFLDMFGDPVTNPKGWAVESVSALCESKQYGTAEKANSEGRGLPVLRMNNLTYEGCIDLTDIKWVELNERDASRLDLRDGDVLFNRVNSHELVGKTAVWHGGGGYTFAGYLIRLRILAKGATGDYVASAMNTPSMKRRLAMMAKPSINMANISSSDLDRLVVPVPPLRLQQKYGDLVARVSDLRVRHRATATQADSLFSSVLSQAFSGQLSNMDASC